MTLWCQHISGWLFQLRTHLAFKYAACPSCPTVQFPPNSRDTEIEVAASRPVGKQRPELAVRRPKNHELNAKLPRVCMCKDQERPNTSTTPPRPRPEPWLLQEGQSFVDLSGNFDGSLKRNPSSAGVTPRLYCYQVEHRMRYQFRFWGSVAIELSGSPSWLSVKAWACAN